MISLICAIGVALNIPLLILYRGDRNVRLFVIVTSPVLLAAGVFDAALRLNGLRPVPWLGAVIYGTVAAFAVAWVCVITEGRVRLASAAGPAAGAVCALFVAFFVTVAVPRERDGKKYVGVYSPLTSNIDTVLTCYEKKGELFTALSPSFRENYGNPEQARPDFSAMTCQVEYFD